MRVNFLHEDSKVKLRCPFCNSLAKYKGRYLNEMWSLNPSNDEEYKILEEKLGDVSNWIVCEGCLQGLCTNPTKWFREIFPKLVGNVKKR